MLLFFLFEDTPRRSLPCGCLPLLYHLHFSSDLFVFEDTSKKVSPLWMSTLYCITFNSLQTCLIPGRAGCLHSLYHLHFSSDLFDPWQSWISTLTVSPSILFTHVCFLAELDFCTFFITFNSLQTCLFPCRAVRPLTTCGRQSGAARISSGTPQQYSTGTNRRHPTMACSVALATSLSWMWPGAASSCKRPLPVRWRRPQPASGL